MCRASQSRSASDEERQAQERSRNAVEASDFGLNGLRRPRDAGPGALIFKRGQVLAHHPPILRGPLMAVAITSTFPGLDHRWFGESPAADTAASDILFKAH